MKGVSVEWLEDYKKRNAKESKNKEPKMPDSMPIRSKLIYKKKKKQLKPRRVK